MCLNLGLLTDEDVSWSKRPLLLQSYYSHLHNGVDNIHFSWLLWRSDKIVSAEHGQIIKDWQLLLLL